MVNNTEDTTNSRIVRRIQLTRNQRSLTVTELSDLCGLRPEQILAFEQDDDMITAVELGQIAQTLNMPVEFFVQDRPLLDWSGEWQVLHTYRCLRRHQREGLIQLLLDLAGDVPVTDRR